MDIPMNVEVQCSNGLVGHSTNIILNPITKTVTHVVVREDKAPHIERVIEIKRIKESTPDLILLNCDKQAFAKMEPFVEIHYVRSDGPDYEGRDEYMWPYRAHEVTRTYTVKEKHIPPHELAVRRGAKVMASDGRIGEVEEFLVEPQNGHITHMVLREGHFWGKKEVTIPVSEIAKIQEEMVYLTLNKVAVEKLPAVLAV